MPALRLHSYVKRFSIEGQTQRLTRTQKRSITAKLSIDLLQVNPLKVLCIPTRTVLICLTVTQPTFFHVLVSPLFVNVTRDIRLKTL